MYIVSVKSYSYQSLFKSCCWWLKSHSYPMKISGGGVGIRAALSLAEGYFFLGFSSWKNPEDPCMEYLPTLTPKVI